MICVTVGGATCVVLALVLTWLYVALELGAVNLIASHQKERNVALVAKRQVMEATAFVLEAYYVLLIG